MSDSAVNFDNVNKLKELPVHRDHVTQFLYITIPAGSIIYRGGEKYHFTRNFPAFYSSRDITSIYTKGDTSNNPYRVRHDLRLLVSTSDSSQNLLEYLMSFGERQEVYGQSYGLHGCLMLLTFPYKDADFNRIRNCALYLQKEHLDDLTKLVQRHNPHYNVTHETIAEQLSFYYNIPYPHISSRTSLRLLDKTIVGIIHEEIQQLGFDGLIHLNDNYPNFSMCRWLSHKMDGETCVPVEIAIFNGNESLVPIKD